MNTVLHQSTLFFTLIFLTTTTNTILCMMTTRPEEQKTQSMPYRTLITSNKNIKILRHENIGDRFDTCFTVALTEILNITGQGPKKLPISKASDLLAECNIIGNYFEPATTLANDVLIAYATHDDSITHFGVIMNYTGKQYTVKSKWGANQHILQHGLWDIPSEYGEKAYFYKIKNEYQDETLLLKKIQTDIAQSPNIKKELIDAQIMLIQLANGKNIIHPHDPNFNNQNTPAEKACYLLKNQIGLNINTRTAKTKQTVLMLATKRYDIQMIQLFLLMGADTQQKDIDNNTALMIAQESKFSLAIALLEKYDATH